MQNGRSRLSGIAFTLKICSAKRRTLGKEPELGGPAEARAGDMLFVLALFGRFGAAVVALAGS